MGRRRGKSLQDTRRRLGCLDEPERTLIVTEGSKTEPDYFRLLIQELLLACGEFRSYVNVNRFGL